MKYSLSELITNFTQYSVGAFCAMEPAESLSTPLVVQDLPQSDAGSSPFKEIQSFSLHSANCSISIISFLGTEIFCLYEGRLISNAHSEIFCQRSIVAMRAQCVLVATTLLHSGAKFHSFLFTGSKTVRVNMES